MADNFNINIVHVSTYVYLPVIKTANLSNVTEFLAWLPILTRSECVRWNPTVMSK